MAFARAKAFEQLCAHPASQHKDVAVVQQLLTAATDLGTEGKALRACLLNLPQATGLQVKLSYSRLLQLLKQACAAGKCWPQPDKQEELLQLLQEAAAQELSGSDYLGVLQAATKNSATAAVTALQQMPAFSELSGHAVLQLVRGALQYSRTGCLEAYIKHAAAAAITT